MNGRQLNKEKHKLRNALPSGYSWKTLEAAIVKAVRDLEVYYKLSDNKASIGLTEVRKQLALHVGNPKVYDYALDGLLRRGLLVGSKYRISIPGSNRATSGFFDKSWLEKAAGIRNPCSEIKIMPYQRDLMEHVIKWKIK